MFIAILLMGVAGAATVIGLVCGMQEAGLSLWQTVRVTYLPKTWREFALPPCPLCWGARAAVMLMVLALVLR